jgi:transcriptional antiterminator NusG
VGDEPINADDQSVESIPVSGDDTPLADTDSTAADETAETASAAVQAEASPVGVAEEGSSESVAAKSGDSPEVDDDDVTPLELIEESEEVDAPKLWYILKVQSNRETSIADNLRRRVKIAGLEDFVDEVIVPVEEVAEYKGGKKRTVKRKLYPGYIVVNMAITDDTWFLVRETPGIGDFTGSAGKPEALGPDDISRILKTVPTEEGPVEPVKPAIPFKPGETVRIMVGTF